MCQHYDDLAENYKNFYLLNIMRVKRGLAYRVINKLIKGRLEKSIINSAYNSTYKNVLRNYVECEAHRELLLRSLKKRT